MYDSLTHATAALVQEAFGDAVDDVDFAPLVDEIVADFLVRVGVPDAA